MRTPRHRFHAGDEGRQAFLLAHSGGAGDVGGRLVQIQRHDFQGDGVAAGDLIDGRAAGGEVGDHLARDFNRIGGDAAQRHAVIGGEHQSGGRFQNGRRAMLPGCQPHRQFLQAAQGTGGFGQLAVALAGGAGGCFISDGQGVQKRQHIGEPGELRAGIFHFLPLALGASKARRRALCCIVAGWRMQDVENSLLRGLPMDDFKRGWWNGFVADWRFLTIVPVPAAWVSGVPAALDVRWFPLVGWIVGGGAAAVYLLADRVGLTPLLCALLALGFLGAVTGLLHEDGLGDVTDSMGGRTTEARLAILRDSRIGVYGAAAAVFCILLRVFALAALGGESACLAAGALATAGAFSRAAMGFLASALDNVRDEGSSAALLPKPTLAAVTVAAVLVLPGLWLAGLAGLLAAVVTAGLLVAALALWAKARLGGRSGDVLGAGQVLAECAFLLAMNGVMFW